jgi:hypothetical protein
MIFRPACLALMACVSAWAQGNTVVKFEGPPKFILPPAMGAPYSAVRAGEMVLSIGEEPPRKVQSAETREYRDAQGRTRHERPALMVAGPAGDASGTVIEIDDPVAGFRLVLDEGRHIAHRMPLPAPLARPARLAAAPPEPPGTVSKSLGTRIINGELAEGHFFSSMVTGPSGPVKSESETWISRDLRIMVFSRLSGPHNDRTTVLKSLTRGEPDLRLFQVPPGYTVVDEGGPFVIEYQRRR